MRQQHHVIPVLAPSPRVWALAPSCEPVEWTGWCSHISFPCSLSCPTDRGHLKASESVPDLTSMCGSPGLPQEGTDLHTLQYAGWFCPPAVSFADQVCSWPCKKGGAQFSSQMTFLEGYLKQFLFWLVVPWTWVFYPEDL